MIKKSKKLIARILISYCNRLFESGKNEMLIVAGHMRSGSSLLVHILNTNPEIIGFGELHRAYNSEKDFGRAAHKIFRSFKLIPSGGYYVMDKVLHTRCLPKRDILYKTQTIFIIRTPDEAMSSMLDMGTPRTSDNPEGVYNYYVKRLRWITSTAKTLPPEKWTFTTYSELTNSHTIAFSKMENFLSLKNSLTREYQTNWATGKEGIGDSGTKINRGKLMKKTEKEIDSRVLPYLEKAKIEYEMCLRELSKNNIYS